MNTPTQDTTNIYNKPLISNEETKFIYPNKISIYLLSITIAMTSHKYKH